MAVFWRMKPRRVTLLLGSYGVRAKDLEFLPLGFGDELPFVNG